MFGTKGFSSILDVLYVDASKLQFLMEKKFTCVFFSFNFWLSKPLDPDPYPYPDSLEMPDPNPDFIKKKYKNF